MTLLCRFGTSLTFILILILLSEQKVKAQSRDLCRAFGNVFIEKERRHADYIVYLEENEAFADMLVFKEDNRLFADKAGLWHFVNSRAMAHFTIFIEKDKARSNFSIYYTDVPSFAGCR
jgi:hypothetical protein